MTTMVWARLSENIVWQGKGTFIRNIEIVIKGREKKTWKSIWVTE